MGLEVGDVSADGRMLTIRQSVWNGQVQTTKTENGVREVDLDPSLASMLRAYIGERTTGMLFCTSVGNPLSQSNTKKKSSPGLERDRNRGRPGLAVSADTVSRICGRVEY
jgi:hypothetical protein